MRQEWRLVKLRCCEFSGRTSGFDLRLTRLTYRFGEDGDLFVLAGERRVEIALMEMEMGVLYRY